MNQQISAELLQQLVEGHKANQKERGKLPRAYGQMDRDIDTFVKELAPRMPIVNPRGVQTLEQTFSGNIECGLRLLDSIASNLRQDGNRAARENRSSDVPEAIFKFVARIDELKGRVAQLDSERRELEKAIAAEMERLASAIAKGWYGRRAETISEIVAALLPFCRDAKQAAEAAEICEKPQQLFRSYTSFSPQHSPVRFDPEQLNNEVRRLANGIAQLEAA